MAQKLHRKLKDKINTHKNTLPERSYKGNLIASATQTNLIASCRGKSGRYKKSSGFKKQEVKLI